LSGVVRAFAYHRYFRFFLSLFFSTPLNEFVQIHAYVITDFDCWLCYFRYSAAMTSSALIEHEYDRAKAGETQPLKPVLASIPNALKYMGDVSRAKFYSDILPLLQTVHIGTRHFVVVASMDRLISSLTGAPAENHDTPMATERGRGAS
jgi:hypothetical protein